MAAKPLLPLQVYKNKPFARFARKARITDNELWQAAQRVNDGLIDADLGKGVIKQRIARPGGGKSGGSRSIILFRQDDRAVYVYGFEKKDRTNVRSDELKVLQLLAETILGYAEIDLAKEVKAGSLIRLNEQEESQDEEVP